MKIYQVDAFTDHVFGGNPAAVCPLEYWLPDEKMQKIAMENNLSETAFFTREGERFHIRWFTPELEIDLCGHATLASAHVIFNHLAFERSKIEFIYGGGTLYVEKDGALLKMNFPAIISEKTVLSDQISHIMGKQPQEVYKSRDLMLIYDNEQEILDIYPDFSAMVDLNALGVIVTARGNNVDFVSRFFAPAAGINEDPVTGSAHCMLIPFWAERLKKNKLSALQLSQRVGTLFCESRGNRVVIAGYTVTFMEGEIQL